MRRVSALWRRTSLRVATLSSALFVLTLVAVGVVAEGRLEATLTSQAQSRAEAIADDLEGEYKREGSAGLSDSLAPRLHPRERRLRYALIDSDDRLLLGDGALCGPVVNCLSDTAGPARQAGPAPLVVRRDLPPNDMSLFVVDDLRFIDDLRSILTQALWYAVGATLLAGAAIGYFTSRSVLRKVGSITSTAEAIISGDLTRRIATAPSADEFDSLGRTLNRMFDRITDLLRNVQQVSTDLAHDLRTPLSRLRQRLEREQTRLRPDDPQTGILGAAIRDLDLVLETFSGLLRIAQIESGRQRSAFRRLDVSGILVDLADTYEAVAAEGGRTFAATIEPGLAVSGDRELLTQLVCNLVENALTHTPEGSRVSLEADRAEGGVRIVVRDDGPGIAPADLPFVFRRLYRGERSRTTPGTGLGLALVAPIVELHGGTISLDDNRPGLVATVRLPLAAPARRGECRPTAGRRVPAVVQAEDRAEGRAAARLRASG